MIIIFTPMIKGNDYGELLANTKQIALFTQLLLHWFPVDVSGIAELFDILLRPVIRFHHNGRALRPNSLMTFLFHLQHIFNSCFQSLLPILARSYNQIFFGHSTYRLAVEYKFPFDCVADVRRLFIVFATFFPFGKW
jgi:hypothetical protein